jgi:transposase
MRYQPLTDEQWEAVCWLLPVQERGRPRTRDRQILNAIVYLLWTGCRWDELPPEFPPRATVHRRFKVWAKAGFFEKLFRQLKQHLPPSAVYHLDASAKAAKKGGRYWPSLEQASYQGLPAGQ